MVGGIKTIASFLVFLVSINIIFISCSQNDLEYYLENDLNGYRKFRGVNEEVLSGYFIKKFAFQKQDSLNYKFIFQLRDDTDKDTIEKYGLGFVFFADQKYISHERGYILKQTKPFLESHGNHKYIVTDISPPGPYLDSLHIYLSGREGYSGVIGKMIRLKNIQLE